MRDEVEGLYRRLLDAWNASDGAAMAACFADDGEMLGFDGSHVAGSATIAAEMASIFSDHETARFVSNVKDVRLLGSGVALLRAAAGMVPPGGDDINPDVNTHHVIVATETGGDWKVAFFQNTPAQFHGRPQLVEEWTNELRKLL